MDKISVIVPIYNVEKYLKQCLDSIITQTYQNLEIILINDGSTDQSLEICRQYAKRDQRIILISQKNSGVSSARNAGLDIATGSFITFIDPDDWLADANSLTKLYNILVTNKSSVVVGNYNVFDDQINAYRLYSHDNHCTNYTPKQWFQHEQDAKGNLDFLFSTPWSKLFKRKLFKNIRFPIHKPTEDYYTMWKAYLLANQITYIDTPFYVYRFNLNGKTISNEKDRTNAFPIDQLEQRFAIFNLASLDNRTEIHAYHWRLYANIQDALKNNKLATFRNALLKDRIIEKYS